METIKSLLMELYPLACVYVPCVIYQLAAVKRKGLKGEIPAGHFIWAYIFILYLYMALSVAGISCVWDIGKFGPAIRPEEINLVPFQSEGVMPYLLNVIMFMPLGFLLPLIWDNVRRIIYVFMAGAGFSAAIELGQLFNRRKTDIDDLIMNVCGALAGYVLWVVFNKVFGRKHKRSHERISVGEPFVYMALAVLGLFFLYNWRILVRLFYS